MCINTTMTDMMETLIHIATQAGKKTLTYYNDSYHIHDKENHSPVTDADLAANEVILSELEKYFSYPILSEEIKDDLSRLKSDYLWIVDPLDGTKDFIKKTGDFSIVIGLAYRGAPVAGVVYKPATDECYYAQKGTGAYKRTKTHDPIPLHVSESTHTSQMKLVVSRSHFRDSDKVVATALGIHQFEHVGSIGIKIGKVAEQDADLYVFTGACCQWDTCAPDSILHEAGGMLTDTYGNALVYNKPEILHEHGLVASNGKVHEHIIETIHELREKHLLK